MRREILSFVIAVSMLLSSMPVSFAYENVEDTEAADTYAEENIISDPEQTADVISDSAETIQDDTSGSVGVEVNENGADVLEDDMQENRDEINEGEDMTWENSIDLFASYSQRTSSPNGVSYYYDGGYNPFYASGFVGECTWYAWGRAYEILGTRPYLPTGNAGTWYDNCTAYTKSRNYYAAKVGAIACYSNHVAVVEAVAANGAPLAVSEGGFQTAYIAGQTIETINGRSNRYFHYGKDYTNGFQGYIYLLNDSASLPHSHSWSSYYESSHPHRVYRSCSCGAKEYTGETRLLSDCRSCYPLGNVSLTRSFKRTEKSVTFYRNAVSNATEYTMILYRDGAYYNQYNMNSTSYRVDGLPSGTYYAALNVRNSNTGQTKSASCASFKLVDSYTVTYNANGGTNAPSSQTKIQGEDMTITSSAPKKTGHIFKGWASSKTATEAQYQPGGVYTKNTPITLYAVWEPETYTINFDLNGGKGEAESATITYGDSMRMPNTAVREGYYLRGWSKTQNASAPDYRIGMDYKLTENITLYAVWASSTWGGSVASGFAGGEGTAEDPYQISNASELAYLADRVNQQTETPEYEYYILTDNINLGYEEWVPIGVYDSGTQYFCGSFDGNGYTVSDLYMSGNNAGYVGLFGCVKNSDIKDLNVSGDAEGQSFSGASYVGAVAGCAYDTDISGCNAIYANISDISNSSSSAYTYVGIMCGYADNSGITDCNADDSYISISQGNTYAGMMVGYMKGDITGCTVSSDVELFGSGSATRYLYMGGVCGYIDGNVEKCSVDAGYFSTTLSFLIGYIGGIAGELNGRIDICSAMFDDGLERTIDGASYMSSFSVEGNSDIGGIVGSVAGGGISNCKYDGQSISSVGSQRANVGGIAGRVNTNEAEKISVAGGQSLSRSALPTRRGYIAAWYTDPDFKNEYDFSQPVTSDMTLYAKWSEGEDEIEIWDGSSVEPAYDAATKTYTVTNGRELAWVSDVASGVITSGTNMPDNANFEGYTIELADDIYLNDISDVDNWETNAPANSWRPIGAVSFAFNGVFDGKNHTINGLYFSDETEYCVGLFRSLEGHVQNLTLDNGYILGGYSIAAFSGASEGGTFENCINKLTIRATAHRADSIIKGVGGIVGRITNGNISNCYNYGTVTGEGEIENYGAGGITGKCTGSVIEYCYNRGDISSNYQCGGITGNAMRSSLKYCYNNGTVKVSDYDSYDYWCGAGGIVGMSFTDNTISYCYNTSSVSGGGAGGIIGNAWDDTISYCYSTGIINGNDSCGGIAGTISLSEMTYIKYCYANQSPLYGSEYNANFMSIISVAYKSSTAMKTLSNLSGFSSSDWAVDAEVNNGYPYLRSLEDTYRIYEVTIVEEPENSDMLSKCFANVDGILYGESAYEGGGPYPLFYISAGGILGFAEGDDKANASNLIAVADRVSSAATKIKPYSGDIVGRIDDDAMDFRSVYSYSSMSKSAVNTTTGAEGYVVETGTPRTITNIQRASFLRTVFGPETYQSLDYLDEHPDAVWVVKDGEFPELYYNVLNDITVSESENGTVSVDKAQAVDGEIVTVTALPNENYVLNKVYVNGNEIDGTTFEVSGDSNVFVTFAEKTPEYDIKVTSSENAEASLLNVDAQQAGDEIMLMSGTDSLTAKDGEEIRVDTEASEDHTVDAVYVNGETLAGDSFIVTADSDITMEVTSISTERKAVTNDAVDVGNYFATLSGSIEGDNETTERYIRYWAADEPDMVYTTEAGPGSGAYSIEVTNLRPETEYKYQMTETGEIKSFVTKSYYTEGSGDEPDVTPSVPVEICFEISDMRVDNGVVCADIANTADSESSGKIILAAYGEDDTLISAELSEIDKMPVGESVSCEFTAVENAVKYKLMIWDSTDKMAPLAESAEVIL